MSWWERFWFGQVSATRPYLLLKGLLLLLGLDCWFNLIPHGARYGAGGFNVAHFAILDLLPVPTPEIYICTVAVCGLLAFSMAVFRPTRTLLAALAALYTYAWACSMLDSFQHHYFLSLVLLSCVFLPLQGARETYRYEKVIERVSAWSYVMIGVTCSIVYFYTAVTKLDPDWRNGDAMRRMVDVDRIDRVRSLLTQVGLSGEDPYQLLAVGAIGLQLATGLGFLLAIGQNRPGAGWFRRHAWLLLPAPLMFHVGAELINLRIGWFSYYMLLIALVFFLPERPLDSIGRFISWLPRMSSQSDDELSNVPKKDLKSSMKAAVPALIFGGALCLPADLPGVPVAGFFAAALVLISIVVELRHPPTPLPFTRATSFVFAVVAFMFVVTLSTVRWDYYRYAAGDHQRRGDYQSALTMYEKANRYAPEGEDRKAQIQKMRTKVKQQGKGRAR